MQTKSQGFLWRWSVRFGLVALCLLTAPAVLAQYDGIWKGTTSQGLDIQFRVTSGVITYIRYDAAPGLAGCPAVTTVELTPTIQITGNGFYTSSFYGSFFTRRYSSGNFEQLISLPTCVVTVSGAWGATRALPSMTLRDNVGAMRLNHYDDPVLTNGAGVFASDPASAQNSAGDTLMVARDAFNALWFAYYSASSDTWGNWSLRGGATKGTPALAVTGAGTGYAAVRDIYNSYWLTSYTPPGSFGAWVFLGGVFDTDPAVAACPDGSLYVVGKDQWKGLWAGRFVPGAGPGTGFQSWRFGGGVVKGKPSVTCGTDNIAYIAARDEFNALWVSMVFAGNWMGWWFGGGVLGADPEIATGGDSQVYALVRDPWNGVWYRGYQQSSADGWQAWVSTGGTLKDASITAASGELFIAGQDPSNGLWWFRASDKKWSYLPGYNNVATGSVSAAAR